METKINVEICVGTYSYIMGGADLMNISTKLPKEIADKIIVKGKVDFEEIDEKSMRPPYAAVNGNLITEANESKIHKAILKAMQATV